MKRLAVAALVVLALVPGAGAGGPAPVWATEWRAGGGVTLLRLHAATLKPVPGRRIDLGYATRPLLVSPDRRRLLAAGQNLLRVADLSTGRLSGSLWPGGSVVQALWTRADTIVVVTPTRAVLAEPARLETRRYVDLGGEVVASARAPGRVVLLLGPEDAIGELRIAVVDGRGAVRSAPIPLRGGNATLRNEERNPVGMRSEAPGLAVDATGERAVVVARTTAVEVDLGTLESTSHALAGRTMQKRAEGWYRLALWLDRDHVAVAGAEYELDDRATQLPVQVIDVRDWTTRTLDARTSFVLSWHSLLLSVGDSLKAYRANGDFLATLLPQRSRGQVVGGESFLYVETGGRGTKWLVLDWDGRVMGRRTFARPMNIAVLR